MSKFDVVIDHKQLKKAKENLGNSFDRKYITDQEGSHKRYMDVCQSAASPDFSARVYIQSTNGGFSTGTVKIKNFREHETTLRHAQHICELVSERLDSVHDDELTQKALNTVNKNDVRKRVTSAKYEIAKYIKQYVQ